MADRVLRMAIDASGAKSGADDAARATDKIRAHSKQATDAIKETERAFDRQAASAQKFGTQVSSSFQRAASSALQGGGSLRLGISSISQELLGATSNAEGMSTALGLSAGSIGGLTAVGAAVAGVTVALANGFKTTLELDKALTRIAARTDPDTFGAYESAAFDLARTLAVDVVQAGQAMDAALVSGFKNIDQQQRAAAIGLKLFRTENVDAAQAINVLDNVLDTFSLTAADAEKTTNQLLTATRLGETTFQDMAAGVSVVGPVAKGLNISLTETLGVLGAIGPKVGGASNAASGLSLLLVQLSDRSSALSKELRKQGIEVDANAIQAKGLSTVLQEVSRGLEGKDELLTQIFGSPRIVKVALSAISDGGVQAKAIIDELTKSTDALNISLGKVENVPGARVEAIKKGLGSVLAESASGLRDIFVGSAELAAESFAKTDLFKSMREQAEKATADVAGRLGQAVNIGAVLAVDQNAVEQAKALAKAIDLVTTSIESQKAALPPNALDLGKVIPRELGFRPSDGDFAQAIGPDIDGSMQKARKSVEDLSRSLNEKLGSALDQEIAKLRNSESVLRDQIAAYQRMEVNTDELTAKLFLLTNTNDQLVGSMTDSDRRMRLAGDSAKRAAIGMTGFADAQRHVGIESLGALVALDAITRTLIDQTTAAHKAISEGPAKMVEDLAFQGELIGRTADAQERLTALRQFDAQAAPLQALGIDSVTERLEAQREELGRLLGDNKLKRDAEQLGHAIADPIGQGVESAILGFQSLDQAAESMVKSILANLLRLYVTSPLTNSISGLFAPKPSSLGNVFQNGNIVPFALGGLPDIVSQPRLFPMAGNRIGSIAEGGKSEAIMPLSRTPSGKLGVETVGGAAKTFHVSIYLNDPGDHRSRRQMVDDLQRMARS